MTQAKVNVAPPGDLPGPRLDRGDRTRELVEVWRLLDPPLAATAAGRICVEEIAALYRLCDDAAVASSPEELAQNDLEFHRRIATAAGNSSLLWLLDGLARPAVSLRIWRGGFPDAARRTATEHRGIVDALASRNAELARCWSTVHVAGVEDRLALGTPCSR